MLPSAALVVSNNLINKFEFILYFLIKHIIIDSMVEELVNRFILRKYKLGGVATSYYNLQNYWRITACSIVSWAIVLL